MTDTPNAGDPFFTLYGGVKVFVSDMIPEGADFGFESPTGRIQWFGIDKAAPGGDQSIHRVYPSFRIDKSLLDNLSDEDLKAADHVSLELRAMALAADLYGLDRFNDTTTSNWPEQGRPFRMEDMLRIMKDMEDRQRDGNVKLVEALFAAGFTVTCNDVTEKPIAVLPEEYRDALEEVLADRDNRDPAENIYRNWAYWPERFDPSHIDELRDGMSPAEFRRLYENDWSDYMPDDPGGC